jgi:hypothetical protein
MQEVAESLPTERPEPRTLMEQLIRQRDVTYEELCVEFDKVARRMGERGTLSVRHLQRLAYGERSGQRSTPTTRRVMRQLFGHSMQELLGPPQPAATSGMGQHSIGAASPTADGASRDLVDRLRSGAKVDDAAVAALAAQTNYLRVMDRRIPGPALAFQLAGHINSLHWLLEHAVLSRNRTSLAGELSDAEALAAWVALDMSDVGAAWRHHEAARLAAREAESPALLAHAMVQQAFVLTEIGEAGSALDLVREAHSNATGAVPELLISWLWAGEGEVLAAAHDDCGSRSAFDRALGTLPAASPDPELPYIQLDELHLARWHGNVLARLGDAAAVDRLYTAIKAEDQSLRAKAALHADLAYTLTAVGDRDQAQRQLTQAERFATQAGSARQRRRLRQLATQCQYVQQRD